MTHEEEVISLKMMLAQSHEREEKTLLRLEKAQELVRARIKESMAYTNPVTSDFKAYFVRDFPYGGTSGDLSTVQDVDIQNAIADAGAFINQGLFPGQAPYNVGFLNLAAHFMVMSLRASSQGIAGQYNWLQSSKGAGPVSESFSIPQWILDNPMWSTLTKTNYGLKFLFLIMPNLVGVSYTLYGPANP